MTTFKSILPANVMDALTTVWGNIISLFLFDTSNTDTGGNLVTINARSGVAIFTDAVSAASTGVYFILNSEITGTESVNPTLYYSGANGIPQICYTSLSSGAIAFVLKNTHASQATNANLKITFQITNIQ